jgi:exopolysaccharide biosynthesis predicted pyruvyltransferase EpsI
MKIFLINNCEKYHAGSLQVTNFFRDEFKNYNLTILKSFKKLGSYNLLDFDVVVANGEGTMHDDAPRALQILNILKEAKQLGIKTLLVNSVWHNNSKETTELLKFVDYISVREILSKKEILKYINKDIDVNIDLSYFSKISFESNNKKFNLVAGNRYEDGNKPKIASIGEDTSIDIFSQSWNDIIKILKRSRILVTGRHHEMYAACKAECPFIILEGNTHKNSGFLKTMNCNIPVLPTNASNEEILKILKNINEYNNEYIHLFSSLSKIKKPDFLKNAGLV